MIAVDFAWPLALWSLVAVPVGIAAYIWLLRRQRRHAIVYSSVATVRAALPRRSKWRQHLPFALVMLAVASAAVAAARPQDTVKVPLSQTTIVLALDVSTSMCATDVAPNRLSASQAAAISFVEERDPGTRVGIVAFSGTAQTVVAPTTDTEELVNAISGFTTSRGTAIGSAALTAIDAIARENPDVAPAGTEVTPDPDAVGEFVPDIVVLLTDGAVSAGVDPIDAADQAAARRVRLYTIGFGTDDPESLVCSRDQLGADALSGPLGSGAITDEVLDQFRQFIVIDEAALQSMADITGGEYTRAEDADQLRAVFDALPAQVELQDTTTEIGVGFVAIAALLAAVAMGLSMWWRRVR